MTFQDLYTPYTVYSAVKATDFWMFDARCGNMGTAIKHPVPDQDKPSFVIFDVRAL